MIGPGCSTGKYDLAARRTRLAAPGAERSHEDDR
jgi:hypothetical protein